MQAKSKQLPRLSEIVWTMAKTQKKQKVESISPDKCNPTTMADKFLLGECSYAAITGREQKKSKC